MGTSAHRKHTPHGFLGKLLLVLWVLPIPSMLLIASRMRKAKPSDDFVGPVHTKDTNERGHYGAHGTP